MSSLPYLLVKPFLFCRVRPATAHHVCGTRPPGQLGRPFCLRCKGGGRGIDKKSGGQTPRDGTLVVYTCVPVKPVRSMRHPDALLWLSIAPAMPHAVRRCGSRWVSIQTWRWMGWHLTGLPPRLRSSATRCGIQPCLIMMRNNTVPPVQASGFGGLG